ncbi:hypothetical protein L226DRAFT_574142 [Lentinus tigrinus ALCF2SS1-7]|uniref:Transcription factor TFIIIC triple barrel domain-containing protein n=1 Tax=Lentinus tigrinus ALCF2SS1-6 TaxID=1328759 RepID=A0A5C2S0D7_9APHY|nr:hypothetical protein L227DRAFT_614164 [Lentinus tigrinus ALCF2SS1-6]RPD71130.1 hypothetical protein L226DRAFT_574142 [Lentinus tigrinus ALCF2SS1-7]
MSALFPGYKQVEAFGSDEDYETHDDQVEEEVEYVTLDLGTVEPTLVPSSSSYRLIGLDTPTPYLQLSGTMLKGQHVSLLGTELLFTEATEEHTERGKKPLVHVANTERRIRFKEVELKPKQAADAQAASAPTAKSSSTAKKVEKQMDHVMSGSAGPSRRGRGGRKRGASKAQVRGKGRVQVQVEESPPEPSDPQPEHEAEASSVSVHIDTAEG